MSYTNIEELPDRVRSELPDDAQECYMRAHNAACARASHAEMSDLTQEAAANDAERTAWEAVKRVYEVDDGGKWQKRVRIEQPWADGQYDIDRR